MTWQQSYGSSMNEQMHFLFGVHCLKPVDGNTEIYGKRDCIYARRKKVNRSILSNTSVQLHLSTKNRTLVRCVMS